MTKEKPPKTRKEIVENVIKQLYADNHSDEITKHFIESAIHEAVRITVVNCESALASSEANFQKERDQIGQILTELVWEIEYLEEKLAEKDKEIEIFNEQAKKWIDTINEQFEEIALLKKENENLRCSEDCGEKNVTLMKHLTICQKTSENAVNKALSELRDDVNKLPVTEMYTDEDDTNTSKHQKVYKNRKWCPDWIVEQIDKEKVLKAIDSRRTVGR